MLATNFYSCLVGNRSKQSFISICLNVTFPPLCPVNLCSHMSVKRSQSMRMAHILKMFDLHPIFVVPIGKTSRAGCVRFFSFYLSRFDTVHQNTKLFSQNRLPGIAQICYQLKILISTQHLFQKKKNVFFIL